MLERWSGALVLVLAILVAAASCEGDLGGSGGAGATSTGPGAGGSVGGSGAASPECVNPGECGVDTTCRTWLCEAGSCGEEHAALGTACDEDGGEICDGRGACVAASCDDGVQDGDETDVDCGGSCGPCDLNEGCLFPDDCVSQTCDAGTCIACPNDVPCQLLGAFFCDGDGTCQPQVSQGTDCTIDNACLSGFCADGKCCDSACDGPCDRCDQPAGTCTIQPQGTAAMACAPYVCDGVNAACPGVCSGNGDCVMGGYCDAMSGNCIGVQKANGQTCDAGNECMSGFCVDGVCCMSSSCPGDCNSCAVTGLEGQCNPIPNGTECRAATGLCDLAEQCDGVALGCPMDAVATMGTACRPSVGSCDPPELCDGMVKACPMDIVANLGDLCRPAAGLCDIPELCDGVNGQCPFDALEAPGVECRASTGECDVAEACDGLVAACPTDGFVGLGTPCGPGVAEPICNPDTCDGNGACQDAPLASGGTPCADDLLFCTGVETCGAGICGGGGDPCTLPTACDETTDACVEVWINELHYDNVSTDVGEGVEVAGTAGADLGGWSLVLYNGNGGATYATINLSGTIPNQQAGLGTAFFAQAGIQNGAPDGLALVAPGGVVVQFLSYEGTFVASNGPAMGLASQDIGIFENNSAVGDSLQLTGTGSSYTDFTWSGPLGATSGAPNTGQTFQ